MSDYMNGREVGLAMGRGERDGLRDRIAALEAELEKAIQDRQEWRSRMGLKTTDAVVQENDMLTKRLAAAESRAAGLAAALDWYCQRVADCRKIHGEGDTARKELDRDGGAKAHAAIAASGLECVRGWWSFSNFHRVRPVYEQDATPIPCTVVIHKEQQHGA